MNQSLKKVKLTITIIILIFAISSVLSIIFINKVTINYDISDYLDDSTQTKIALEIIEDEFGMTGSIQIMAKNVSAETADDIYNIIKSIDNVLNVSFDKNSIDYYKDGNALFVVLINGDDYSGVAKQVCNDIKKALESYEQIQYGGTAIEKHVLQNKITGEMAFILAISICLVAIILLITVESWIEPIILLIASGIAVLLNLGTNVFLGQISYITNSISAILQLALSIDYSIVLLHSYRKCKIDAKNNEKAMIDAIKQVIKPVSASALTTIAGLLALLFMSFTIGFDIGIVLIKGIVISSITSITLFPSLILLFDTVLQKTHKKSFIPKGSPFSTIAIKLNKLIVPIVIILIVSCGILQTKNKYTFSSNSNKNNDIESTFGQNNSIAVLYRNDNNDFLKEIELIEKIELYKKQDNTPVLKNYTAFTNTIYDLYDVEKATEKLNLPKSDVQLLFTMYNIYKNNSALSITPKEFIDYSIHLLESESDIQNLIDPETINTLRLLNSITNVMSNNNTAQEFYEFVAINTQQETNLDLYSIEQLYGLYDYNNIENPNVEFIKMLDYIISISSNEHLTEMINKETISNLRMLSFYIKLLDSSGNNPELSTIIHTEYSYDQFLSVLSQVVLTVLEKNPQITVDNDAIQQIYIMYFREKEFLQPKSICGKVFVEFVLNIYNYNSIVHTQLSECNKAKLIDMLLVNNFMKDTTKYTYPQMHKEISTMQKNLTSEITYSIPSEDTIAGVYIKYLESNNKLLTQPIMAHELLSFICEHMDTNELLKSKITVETREKILNYQKVIQKALNLFIGKDYTRLLLSVNLPSESKETSIFIEYLTNEVKSTFGDNAYIAGELVSIYDLEQSFKHDNLFITIFTLVSIFLIVMIIFRSLSLPIILVTIIQGAIFIAMSTQLVGNGIFFMSYIVSTCILMGATIDYGILMSSTYITSRRTMAKNVALENAVQTAMPTVFTSGLILTICGFVIHFISSQNVISSVGLLIGIGALCSIIMITLVLPAILYLLDKFILKFTFKKNKD